MASNRRDSDLLSIPGKRPTFTTSSSDEEIRLGSRVTFTENVSLVFYFNNHPLPSMEPRDIFSDGRVLKLLCNPMLPRGECRICHKGQSQIMKKGLAKHKGDLINQEVLLFSLIQDVSTLAINNGLGNRPLPCH